MKRLLTGASAIAVSSAIGAPALAQVEEIVVTATKREETAQDVAVAVQALGTESLEELRVANFQDYLVQLPGVTAGGAGPGQNTIYIRGLASTTPNLTTAAVAGLAPNVALYLDEQPVSQPGRNLDVYAVDFERVEVLPGPQGTLFGASSQAGTVRLITNKPVIGEYQAFANAGWAFTDGGEASRNVNGMLNLPIGDKAALRGVFYYDDQGGFIDNVPGTVNASESARFRPAGTVRDNGTVVSERRGGFQAGSDLSGVTFLDADNSNIAQDDFNDATYAGFRIAGRYEFNDDWRATVSYARQQLETEGVFLADPELGDWKIQRYEPEEMNDTYDNIAWTLEGRIGALEAVYTGAYTDRSTDQRVDYTDYLFVGQYLPYYICDSSVSYPGDADPAGTCQPPNLFVDSTTETEFMTHELRFNTPRERRLRATFGGFCSDLEIRERNDFTYPGSVEANVFGSPGFFPNFPFTDGFVSDPGPFPPGAIFRNDVKRTDEQFGIFGEASFDVIRDTLTLTFGTRYYDVSVDLDGSANGSFCNSFQPDINAFGTNIADLYDGDGEFTFRGTCDTSRFITYNDTQSVDDILAIDPALSQAQAEQIFNATRAPDKAETNGFIFKGSVSWTPTEDVLLYATYSEGFRPGLLNRPGGAIGAGGTGFVVPFVVDSDEVTNYELGWKTDFLDKQIRFNGNAFFVQVERLQTTIFDPSITNLLFSANAADAEIKGVEGDIIVAPAALSGLTVRGAFSVLDTEITDVLIPTNDVLVGEELAFAPGFQGNLLARYDWNVGPNYTMHIQPQIVYSGSSFTDIIEINKIELDSWTTFALSAGIRSDRWSFELYGDNLTNEAAQVTGNFVFDRARVSPIRPRTIGARIGFRY